MENKPMQDHIARAMAMKGRIRAIACVTTKVTQQVVTMQQTSPIASIALGRAMTGVALLSSTLKQGQKIALKLEGNGPLAKIVVEADWDGALRGTVGNPNAVALSVPEAIGKAGFLTLRKDLGLKEPYTGIIPLYTSEIGEDIAYYLTDSEQTPSAVGVTVRLSGQGEVEIAGGFMIQSLPPSDPEVVDQLMESIQKLPPLHELLTKGVTPHELLEKILIGCDHHMLETTNLHFSCSCSLEKVEQALLLCGVQELNGMLTAESLPEITCEFCKHVYRIGKVDIERLIQQLNT